MNNFTSKTILGSRTLGDRLKRTRQQNQLTIEQVAEEIKISPQYLFFLENGQYNKLPGTLYIENYLKKYCHYLNLDLNMMQKIYQQEITIYQQKNPKKLQSKYNQKALVLPKIIIASLLVLLGAGISIYIVSEIVNISRPPQLEIYDLAEQSTITEHTITLKGKTDPEAQVTINGQKITIDSHGNFTEIISLQTGLNTIKIGAKSKHSKERIIYKQILVKNN